jgi:hypothetical protein
VRDQVVEAVASTDVGLRARHQLTNLLQREAERLGAPDEPRIGTSRPLARPRPPEMVNPNPPAKRQGRLKAEPFRATGSGPAAALHCGLEAQQGVDQLLGLAAAHLAKKIGSELWMVDLG